MVKALQSRRAQGLWCDRSYGTCDSVLYDGHVSDMYISVKDQDIRGLA